jgi:Zn-dependent peptidase ImmA (M78 family)
MAGYDTNRGAKRARELREGLGLDAAAPIACLLEVVEDDLGIPVCIGDLAGEIEGVCWRTGDGPMLWLRCGDFVPRTRFTLAHELGHVRCDHDGAFIVDTWETLDGVQRTNAEIQANAFAAELLAPKVGVLTFLDARPTLEDVVRMAAHFGMSTIAALYRCVTCGVVEDVSRLKREIEEGLHLEVWEQVAPPTVEDGLARVDPTALPRLSPLLGDSALASLLRGDASVEDVALQTDCDPGVLSEALETLGV